MCEWSKLFGGQMVCEDDLRGGVLAVEDSDVDNDEGAGSGDVYGLQ